jgi:cystathionine gamma-synthase
MSHSEGPTLQPATRVVAGGRPRPEPGAPLVAPITLTSTYAADGDDVYARDTNPTWTAFEDILGSLEGGQALLFASGMAAITAAIGLVPTGSTVVAPVGPYNGTAAVLAAAHAAGDLAVRWVDMSDTAASQAATVGAGLVWLESPTNPLLDTCDIPAIVEAAHDRGAIVVCDNTFATPLCQRPLADGADVVVHSVTKYLSGHSDVVLGACVTAPTPHGDDLAGRLARARLLGGAIPGPTEAWLATRGLRTLSVRLTRASRNAAILAARLAAHPRVARVRYPGFGAMISLEVTGTGADAERVCRAAHLISRSTSLGGVESQWERRRRYAEEPPSTPDTLIRLSVGIEDVEDLWADLTGALQA